MASGGRRKKIFCLLVLVEPRKEVIAALMRDRGC